jgi:UDP-N-acetylmuramate: L-alanyl-gamma-D-glutamyl-meso-diaminopimelate ligase
MSEQLAALGIELTEGYGAEQLARAPDLWVVGNVVTRGNPLMEAILDAGQPYVSGPQWLAEHMLPGRHVLAVAGTHGKTGTASMLAWILEQAGRKPGFLVGGVPTNFGVSARLGESDLFVIEADEYDTAFFDKRSKFVHYPARTAILNNLEFDHADIFLDLAAIERQFHHFVRILPKSGLIVANGRDEALQRVLAQGCWTSVERFGVEGAWQAGAPDADNGFDVRWGKEPQGRVRWSQAGEHSRLNALAAIAAARHAGVGPGRAIEALASFTGVRRRLELRGTVRGVAVYDDFAHHPTAIRATLEGLRAQRGAGRILAVLEPRSNTMKLGIMKDRLAASLAGADRAYVYAADLGWDAAVALQPLGERARSFEQLDALVAALAAEARPGDRVVVMSNGGFGGVHDKLLAAIGAQAAA